MEYICEECKVEKPKQFFKFVHGKVYHMCNKCLNQTKKMINYHEYSDVKKYKN
jgi:hypothetical protein